MPSTGYLIVANNESRGHPTPYQLVWEIGGAHRSSKNLVIKLFNLVFLEIQFHLCSIALRTNSFGIFVKRDVASKDTKAGTATSAEAQVRLQKLEEYFKSFEEVQGIIEDKVDLPEEEEELSELNNPEREIFEHLYYKAAAIAQEIIGRQEREARTQITAKASRQNREGTPEVTHRRPKLPEIKLPEFNGDYTQWSFFKDSFETTIHQDDSLTAVQKHQYLIGLLQGEARSIILGFKISSENYESAWKLLKDTYDNNTVIIQNHLEELLNFPEITKDNKSDSMRRFIWHIQTHVSALRTLSLPVNAWDAILMHLAKKRLDYGEQRDWQNLIKKRTQENMPKLSEFLAFLTERCHNQGSRAGSDEACVHLVFKCGNFQELSITDRKKKLKEKKLCFNCLGSGHFVRECKASTCKKCNKKHNSIIHEDVAEEQGDVQAKQACENSTASVVMNCTKAGLNSQVELSNKQQSPIAKCDLTTNVYCANHNGTRVVLSTAKVRVSGSDGEERYCRALLDPGSQSNLVTSDLMRRLRLSCRNEIRPIGGINKTVTTVNKISYTGYPTYDKPGPIDMLFGAGVYWKIIIGALENHIKGRPALQNTHLGVIIGGELEEELINTLDCCNVVTNSQLQSQLQRFWIQEEVPEVCPYSPEEMHCENLFSNTTTRQDDGRFIVRLPIRSHVNLGDSMPQAIRRLSFLERCLSKDPELKKSYNEFLREYLQQGHMSAVENQSEVLAQEHYVIPHQPVFQPESTTTKLRVVFDASSKTTSGASLNDTLMPGPNLQADLQRILIRFRTHEFALTADITSMFRQILVDHRDRNLQLILWRDEKTQYQQLYKLNTVTYGTASAPFLSMRCLKELANIYKREFPLAAKAIKEDFYMDDVLSGGPTLKSAITLQTQLTKMLARGHFPLRKWRANHQDVLKHLSEHSRADNLLVVDKDQPLKTLGLLWNATTDTFQYQVFDPLGLVAPVLIVGKIIMQKIWQQQVEWDQELPKNLRIAWEDYNTSLARLNDIRVHRNVNIRNQVSTFDLYGAKVAPLKTISLPRLELEAVLLLAQLYNIVKRSYRDKINKVRLWSDSMITLSWIKTPPHLLKTFVATRASKIQGLTEEATFLESCRSGRKATPLTAAKLERAERIILRWVQQEAFPVEIRYLQEGRPFPRKSQLRALSAYIDEEGLISVGGRLQHAEIKSEQKNPIVLPTKHHVTSIILRDRHERLLHCPPEQLLHDVRQRFWPISGRREVRKIIKKYVKCYRINPTTMEIKMGELPAERIRSVDRPFTITGIDYASPIQIRESKRRGRIHVSKGYVAVFVCTSTKVVHLEMVTDLSTDAFIATLRRFIARKGLFSQILSDNGTNFVGAAKHLKELYEFLIKEQKSIESELAEHRIKWRFIPPRAPHFGGLWEAAVKSTKRHLHTIQNDAF
ncbi:PREDICTED: uncharacterized protein LOC105557253 [Vollenhovia emeryi]|uniref:uncharacterized protein LOC105557253 n=1 Tax=Vollenhovia emeryi TaxID=411798 RepID=UPI0005F3EEE7|nr:PREDICTED: uncharacterized protein LOC105557253 [Vollenhovia emeryi]